MASTRSSKECKAQGWSAVHIASGAMCQHQALLWYLADIRPYGTAVCKQTPHHTCTGISHQKLRNLLCPVTEPMPAKGYNRAVVKRLVVCL